VGGCEQDGRRTTGISCFFPPQGAQAPSIAGFQAGKVILGNGRTEIVALRSGEFEKFSGYFRTDDVGTEIFESGVAEAIAIEAGAWGKTAGF